MRTYSEYILENDGKYTKAGKDKFLKNVNKNLLKVQSEFDKLGKLLEEKKYIIYKGSVIKDFSWRDSELGRGLFSKSKVIADIDFLHRNVDERLAIIIESFSNNSEIVFALFNVESHFSTELVRDNSNPLLGYGTYLQYDRMKQGVERQTWRNNGESSSGVTSFIRSTTTETLNSIKKITKLVNQY